MTDAMQPRGTGIMRAAISSALTSVWPEECFVGVTFFVGTAGEAKELVAHLDAGVKAGNIRINFPPLEEGKDVVPSARGETMRCWTLPSEVA